MGMNLGTYMDEKVKRFCDLPFMFYYDRTITYGEFGRQVDRLAHGLSALGFKAGDFIHVLVENSPETLISYFAIQKIGAVAGPINGWWKAGEVEYLLNDSKGRGLIVESQYLPILDEILDRLPHLETVIETGDAPRASHVSLEKLIAAGGDEPLECTSDDTEGAYIFYTSGTTGNPKGVLLSHRNVLADIRSLQDALKLEEGLRILIFLPLFHVNAMITSVSTLDSGGTVVLRKKFSAGEFWEVVEKYRVNFWSAVPAVYRILLSDPGADRCDRSSLLFGICGAAPMPEETFREFEQAFGIPIVEGYGLTEGTCVSTINPRDGVRKTGSVGVACPGQEVLIFDEEGNELPAGEPGEIVVRGDNVMMGYYNRAQETAQALAGGVLHTGDVGYKDEDGYVFIVDRIKDMVIRGGENIYPKEIDNLLATHPKIAEAASVGVPDRIMGEEVKAFIVPSDPSLTEEEVKRFCKENLAGFKVPRYVELLEEDFPRNPVGKVLKKVLKQWGLTPRPKKEKREELVMLRQLLSIPQHFSTGPVMGRFLKELRNHKRILGNKCPSCGRIQTPPREVCAVCRVRVEGFVELGPEGRIGTWDIAYYASPDPLTGESREAPYCTSFILLDGCTGNDVFWHEIKPADIGRVRKGARVRPVWAEERTGAITDIKYFEIVD